MQSLLFDPPRTTATRFSPLASTLTAVPVPIAPPLYAAAAHPPPPYQAARAPSSRSIMRTFSITGIVHEYDRVMGRVNDGSSLSSALDEERLSV